MPSCTLWAQTVADFSNLLITGTPPADMTPLDLSGAQVFQFTSAPATDRAINMMAQVSRMTGEDLSRCASLGWSDGYPNPRDFYMTAQSVSSWWRSLLVTYS